MSKIKFKAAIVCLVIFSILFSTNLPIITLAQINSDPVVELPGTISPDLGAPAIPPPGKNAPTPQNPAQVVIVMTPRNESAFKALSEAVQNPASPRYRQPLTDAEYRQNYAPDAKVISAIKSYFAGQGLSLDYESAGGLVLSFKGTVAQRDKAFSTSTEFRGNTKGETGLINVTPLKLPVSLAKNIKGVLGFDQLHTASVDSVKVKPGASPNVVTPNSVSQNSPASLRAAYNFPSDLNGTGTKVGIVLWTAPDLSNTNRWKADNGITGSVTLIAVDPASNMTPNSSDLEAHMDIQLVLSAATNASVRFYVARNNFFDSLGVALQKAIDDNVSSLSSSWGACETAIDSTTRQAYSTIFQNASAKGIPVFFSSGDSGAFECNSAGSTSVVGFSQFPASDPQVTSVGGTSLDRNPNNTWNNETAWSCTVGNDVSCLQSNGGASTGGATVNYTRPPYQSSIMPPTEPKFTNTATNTRLQPDISTNGDPASGEPIYTNGCVPGNANNNCYLGGGTSASAPFMAGIAALAVQKKGGVVSGLNNFVYTNFPGNWGFDVTSGYNGVTAKPGWDYTTGKGSIKDVTAFLNAFVIPAPFLTASLAPIIELAGNNDGVIDPGETIGLKISLANTGNLAATGVSGTLSLTGGTANITGPISTYPDITVGSSANNNSNYVFSTVYTQTCGSTLSFRLTVSYNSSLTFIYNFNLKIGSPQTGSPITYSNNTPVAIPDNNGLGINSLINVPTTADAADVNVTVNITHPFDGDLALKLISPNNSTINLSINRGGSGDNYTGTIFDSQAATSISSGIAPFTGSFQPEQSLNVLNNNPVNGNWTLNVADTAPADIGTLNNWSLAIQPITYTCTVYNPVPAISTLSPASGYAGGDNFILTINGSKFVNGSVVLWNNSARLTTFVNSGQLTAQIFAADITSSGNPPATVVVQNPAPGGGTSNSTTFSLTNAVPILSNTYPDAVPVGQSFTLTINGSYFVTGMKLNWSGPGVLKSYTTTYINNHQIIADIPGSDLPAAGPVTLTLTNPAPGGGNSSASSPNFSISDTCLNRVVTLLTDTTDCGTLRNAITNAPANGGKVYLAVNSAASAQLITLGSALPALSGVSVYGTCRPGGPGVTIDGSTTNSGLSLTGGNTLFGLKFKGFGNPSSPQLKVLAPTGGTNKLTCSKISKS